MLTAQLLPKNFSVRRYCHIWIWVHVGECRLFQRMYFSHLVSCSCRFSIRTWPTLPKTEMSAFCVKRRNREPLKNKLGEGEVRCPQFWHVGSWCLLFMARTTCTWNIFSFAKCQLDSYLPIRNVKSLYGIFKYQFSDYLSQLWRMFCISIEKGVRTRFPSYAIRYLQN